MLQSYAPPKNLSSGPDSEKVAVTVLRGLNIRAPVLRDVIAIHILEDQDTRI
jgi:hypothetical protein